MQLSDHDVRSTLAECQKPLEKNRQIVRDKEFHGMVRRLVEAYRSTRVVERKIAGFNEADIVECST
jgi:hypothetical protein